MAQLTKGDSDEAALCKTLVWAMRAPVILAEPADASEEALATEAVENLQDAVDDATGVDSLWLSQTIRGDKGAQGASGVDAIYLCRARLRRSNLNFAGA